MEKRPFSDFKLSPGISQAIDKLGYELASPIQGAAIPPLLEGKDLVGQSPTGSGKTAAFGIPIIERIDPSARHVQAIILCPTRELAVQVAGEIHKLAAFTQGVQALPVYGGAPFDRQAQGLRKGAQIVIGTPGRVLDHLRRGTLKLDQLKTVVLDEADEMLDMGFIEDIETVLDAAPDTRQTVCFSATMPKPIRNLIDRFTKDPVTVTVASEKVNAPDIEQVYYEVGFRSKPEVLSRLIDTHDAKLSIVFCNTKRNVDDLVEALVARGYAADRLHGDMPQTMRTRVMNSFRNGTVEILVATDVAARGLDVDDIDIVFNADLPFDPEDYVHRIGRTGRAGRSGKAITFVSGRDVYKLQHIQRLTKKPIQRVSVPTIDELEEKRHDAFYDKLHALLEKGDFPRSTRTIDRLLAQEFSPTDITAAALHLLHAAASRPPEPIPEDRPKGKRRERGERADRPQRQDRPDQRQDDRPPRSDFRPPAATGDTARLYANIGAMMKVTAGDIAGVMYNATPLPQGKLGRIRVLPKHSLIELPSEHADAVLNALQGIKIRGKDVRFDHDRSAEFGDAGGGTGGGGDRKKSYKRDYDNDDRRSYNRDDRRGGGGGGGRDDRDDRRSYGNRDDNDHRPYKPKKKFAGKPGGGGGFKKAFNPKGGGKFSGKGKPFKKGKK
ncbi:MAG: DEAD/DEAH box helicase [Verrucomicrobiales bacterium]|nr:DEAD/DEAH box helicase [Verrucomicrobiales bacterium]